MDTLFCHIEAAGIPHTSLPSVDDMTQTIQHLHLSDIVDYDDGASTDGLNDIDISCIIQGHALIDFDMGVSLDYHICAERFNISCMNIATFSVTT